MKYSKCSVPGCISERKDVKLHKFPKCAKNLKRWKDSINSKSLNSLRVADIVRLQVCHKHFERRFVTEKSRILGNAYPTLFSPEEIATGKPLSTLEETDNTGPSSKNPYSKKIHNDHNYHKRKEEPEKATSIPVSDIIGTLYYMELPPSPTSPSPSTSPPPSPPPLLPISQNVSETATVSQKQEIDKKQRLVQNIEAFKSKCRQLYKEYRKCKKIQKISRRIKKAIRFSKENSFEGKISLMNPLTRKLLLMQVQLYTNKIKGRSFTLDEKLMALSIMKKNPEAYRFIQRIFILPTETTLKKTVQKLNVEPGINTQIFQSIKEEVDTWKEEKKYCSIIFDKMALEPGLTYKQNDEIVGLVNLSERNNQFADHALVFMVKGAIYKWQQTIAFYFCQGATPAIEYKRILKDIVSAVGATGLIPVALISDQGAALQSAIKSFQGVTKREQTRKENTDGTIKIDGFKLSVITDPHHLMKGIRNKFLTKDISFKGKRAKWMDIVDIYKTDCQHANTRLLSKLNDEDVIPEKIKKMKVKHCERVFSKTMAGALFYTSAFSNYADGRHVSGTLKSTAEVVSFLSDLFDSVNGVRLNNSRRKRNDLRTAVTASSKHHNFWRDAIKNLDKFKFVNEHNQKMRVPSIKNVVSTIHSFQRLWHFFSSKGIKIMQPRYLTSDEIENYFDQVRAHNVRNVNPDCHTFVNSFKLLLVTGFITFHSAYNCEDDSSKQAVKIKSLYRSLTQPLSQEIHEPHQESNKSQASSSLVEDSVREARRERLNIHEQAYTAMWVIRKICNQNKCKDCITNLTVSEEYETRMWITQQEYKTTKRRKLTYPTDSIVRCFGTTIQETNHYLETNAHTSNIAKEIKQCIIQKYYIENIGCQIHACSVQDAFLQISIKLAIFNWINVINKIFKGVDVIRLETRDNLSPMQKKALNKLKQRYKKK